MCLVGNVFIYNFLKCSRNIWQDVFVSCSLYIPVQFSHNTSSLSLSNAESIIPRTGLGALGICCESRLFAMIESMRRWSLKSVKITSAFRDVIKTNLSCSWQNLSSCLYSDHHWYIAWTCSSRQSQANIQKISKKLFYLCPESGTWRKTGC